MGILIIYNTCRREHSAAIYVVDHLAIPYYSIVLSLNVILTLTIVIRLALHSKDIRDAMGPLSRPDKLYKTIITILIESSALYAINFIAFFGQWRGKESVGAALFPLISQVQVRAVFLTHHNLGSSLSNRGNEQVIAPFLIIFRVANRTALTTDTIATGDIPIGSLHFASQGGSEGRVTLSDGYPLAIVDMSGDVFDGRGVSASVETTVDEVGLSQGPKDPRPVT